MKKNFANMESHNAGMEKGHADIETSFAKKYNNAAPIKMDSAKM